MTTAFRDVCISYMAVDFDFPLSNIVQILTNIPKIDIDAIASPALSTVAFFLVHAFMNILE
jgi:hypothetical protein